MSASAEYMYEYQDTYMVDLSRPDEWGLAREEKPLSVRALRLIPHAHALRMT